MTSHGHRSLWSETTGNTHDLVVGILLTFSATLLVIWLYKYIKTTSRLPPGPIGLPVVGYLPFLGSNLLVEFTKMAKRFGPIYQFKIGSKPYVVVTSSELAKVILREQDGNFCHRETTVAGEIVSYGGQNMSWSDNNLYWRNLRKVFASEVISKKNLEASRTFRQSQVRKTIKHMYERMGTEIDVGEIAFVTSLNVMTNMIWGKSLAEDEKSSKFGAEFREVITEVSHLMGAPNVSDIFPILSRFDLQGIERKMRQEHKKVDQFLERYIQERLAIKPQEAEVEQQKQQGRKDFLQILLELMDQNTEASLNITQIKSLLVDMIIGATETSSIMVEWTMAELLQHPNIMQKVKDELEQVVGLNNVLEESHIPNLRYLEVVVKESFRLHPPGPFLGPRSPHQTCTVGGYTIPKDSMVFVIAWAIQRDPKYWENPLEFNPNRFLSSDGTTSKFDYSGYDTIYMPFGSGRRRCPGLPMGEKMFMYMLASFLHSFDWRLPIGKEYDKLSIKSGFIARKEEPLRAIPSQRLSNQTLYM